MSTEQNKEAALASGGPTEPLSTSQAPKKFRTIESALYDEGQPTFSNFDGDPRQQYALIALAIGGECKGFEDLPKGGIDL